GGGGAVGGVPEGVAQQRDVLVLPVDLVGGEPAAELRPHAEQLEEAGRGLEPHRLLRVAVAGHRDVPPLVGGDVLERPGVGAVVEEAARRDAVLELAQAVLLLDRDEPVELGEVERPDQQVVDDAEHRAAGAETQRQREHRDQREPGLLGEDPDREAHVLEQGHGDGRCHGRATGEGKDFGQMRPLAVPILGLARPTRGSQWRPMGRGRSGQKIIRVFPGAAVALPGRMRSLLSLLLLAACTPMTQPGWYAVAPGERHVRINGAELDGRGLQTLAQLEARSGQRTPDGDYWYDARSGAAGRWGGPVAAVLPAGAGPGGPPPPHPPGRGTRGFITRPAAPPIPPP